MARPNGLPISLEDVFIVSSLDELHSYNYPSTKADDRARMCDFDTFAAIESGLLGLNGLDCVLTDRPFSE